MLCYVTNWLSLEDMLLGGVFWRMDMIDNRTPTSHDTTPTSHETRDIPPAPMNHVKCLRAGPAEMPFRNWYTANTDHFHLTDSVRWK